VAQGKRKGKNYVWHLKKNPSVKVAGDPHGTAKTEFLTYVGSESVKPVGNNVRFEYF